MRNLEQQRREQAAIFIVVLYWTLNISLLLRATHLLLSGKKGSPMPSSNNQWAVARCFDSPIRGHVTEEEKNENIDENKQSATSGSRFVASVHKWNIPSFRSVSR